jgi:hypothetical protein
MPEIYPGMPLRAPVLVYFAALSSMDEIIEYNTVHSDARLIQYAYAFEQAGFVRKPPPGDFHK